MCSVTQLSLILYLQVKFDLLAGTPMFSFIEREKAEGYLSSFTTTKDQVIPLKNPLSSENDTMRTSLIPGLLKTVSSNLSKGQKPLKLFEIGSVYYTDSQGNQNEKKVLTTLFWPFYSYAQQFIRIGYNYLLLAENLHLFGK